MVHFFRLRLYLGIENVSCLLLLWIARMDMDWNVKKLGQLFKVLMLCLQKWPKTIIIMVSALFHKSTVTVVH